MNELVSKTRITSLEIADFAGRQHKHVMRDIRNMEPAWEKVNGSKFGLVEYKDAKGENRPMYSLTKEESLYVVSKYDDEVRARLIRRWRELEKQNQAKPLSMVEISLIHAKALVEQERISKEHQQRIDALEAKVLTRPEYYSVAGYARLKGYYVGTKQASAIGRKASRLCKSRGIEIEKTNDPRWGYVNVYPSDVLDEVFEQ
jgi:Rha family phage regulatory protein